jgi:NhaP-type Na+/H+ or K+/H+ antiporter
MRVPRFRLRTVMITIAFLALILTVIMQGVFLQRAAVREQMLRAEAELARAQADLRRARAEAALQQSRARDLAKSQAALDQLLKPVQE